MLAHPYFPAFVLGASMVLTVALIFFVRNQMGRHTAVKTSSKLPFSAGQGVMGRNKDAAVDVFRWSSTFWAYGLLVTLGLVIASLNWTAQDRSIRDFVGSALLDIDIAVEPPRTAEPPPPPPPPPPPVIQPKEILDIPDYEQPEFQDMSLDADTEVYAPAPPAEFAAPPPPPPPPPPRRVEEDEIFVVAEDMPRFPGCEDLPTKREKEQCASTRLIQFIYEHIEYPPMARENGIEGMVVISFVVEPDGKVSNASVVRDIGGGCGQEALRVVKLMNTKLPPWIPGKQRGQPVRVQFNLPVRFMLTS